MIKQRMKRTNVSEQLRYAQTKKPYINQKKLKLKRKPSVDLKGGF